MSKPAPSPPHHAVAAAAAAASSYPPPPAPTSWLAAGYINDKFSQHCQRAQGRPFLRTGVRPKMGQRVELTIFLASDQREHMPFRLSGEVVHAPAFGWAGDAAAEGEDADAHHVAAGALTMMGNGRDAANSKCSNSAWRPSTSTIDCGVNGGSMALAHVVRALLSRDRPYLEITGEMLGDAWAHNFSDAKKEEASKYIVKTLGALHGQRVVCEGRLNFDYDIRRGSEEGPWIDGIPFDGRDVWQFTLVADDSLENLWRADPYSFVNLGPAHRSRCWPWSDGNALPYQRSGTDAPIRGPGPDGAISVHICVGPHGCSGKDHPHNYQAQAA